MKLKRLNQIWNRITRNDMNENFDKIERDFNGVVDVVSNKAYDQVVDAAKLNWLEPVGVFADLRTTYPNALEGDTAMAREVVDGVNKVYRYNGAQWKEIQQISADAVNEVDERLSQQLSNTMNFLNERAVDVKVFGAKGDGVTDDTAAFRAAIVAAGVGGKIFVPKGIYLVNRLYLNDRQSMFGVGVTSILRLLGQHITNPSGFGGVLNAFGSISNPIRSINIYDLQIDGNKANITTPNPNIDDIDIEGINFKYAKDCTVSNVRIINAVDSGVDIDSSNDCTVFGVRAEDCGGYGIHLSSDSANIAVSDSVATRCGASHLRGGFDTYTGVRNCKYVNCHTIDCYIGFWLRGEDNQLVNCSDIGATQNALRLEGPRNKVVNFNAKDSFNNSISIPSSYNELLNVLVDGANACFYVEGSNNKFTNCTAKDSIDGFKLAGTANNLVNCTSLNPSRYGYDLVGQRNSLNSCDAENAQVHALRITADSQRLVNFEAKGSADVGIYLASNKNTFIGGSSRNNAKSGMWVNAVADNIIQGMSFIANEKGIFLDGSNTKVFGCIFENNTLGAVDDTGTTNKYALNIGLSDN